jgi:subtilisin family serine protease
VTRWIGIPRVLTRAALATLGLWLAACASVHVAGSGIEGGALSARADSLILVTVANPRGPLVTQPGSTPHGYDRTGAYAVGDHALAVAAALERQYGLQRVREWPIAPLHVHCLVFALPPHSDRSALLQRLAHDPRVQLAQPLQLFASRGDVPAAAAPAPNAVAPLYNDPYFGLQRGFSTIQAAAAQRWSSGEGVSVAIIDTGVDLGHPDLSGRIELSANFIDQDRDSFQSDRHGTAVAGLIGALANNNVGIVGVAPGARLQIYKACQPVQRQALEATCNSFTLALALSAAIEAHAQLVNLSLGGPPDPLLEQLVRYGERQGMIFVGAVPEDGNLNGFPVAINGVIAVDVSGRHHGAGVLYAPGRDIVTLAPAGHYDFGSGSSFATAHVTGSIALLLARVSHLDAQRLLAVLAQTETHTDGTDSINVCAALSALRPQDDCLHVNRSLATSTGR